MNRLSKFITSPYFHELLDNLEPVPAPPPESEDLPPELCSYRDEGCELAPSCLECPFPRCFLDLPAGQGSLPKLYRDQAIREAFYREKTPVSRLVQRFSVSERTVRRALKKKISRPAAGTKTNRPGSTSGPESLNYRPEQPGADGTKNWKEAKA